MLGEVARDALRIGREEAKVAGVDYVGVAHLLIGLLKVSPILRAHCVRRGIEPRLLRAVIRGRLGRGTEEKDAAPEIAERLERLLERAGARARTGEEVGEVELLIALSEERTGVAADIVKKLRLGEDPLTPEEAEPASARPQVVTASRTPMLDRIGRDLTALARANKLPPFVGRKDLIKKVLVALARHTKPNVVLVGEAGVGKTAIAEGLAQRIVEGNVPPVFKDLRLVAVEPSALAAGASLVGEAEKRLRQLVEEASDPSIVVFFDEMHTLMGLGHSAMNAGDVLKPALARGAIRVIGATTTAEHTKFVERDAAVSRRFEKVEVTEPSPDEALEMLRGLKERLENHHDVTIDDGALEAAVSLSSRYLPDRRLPDKAIDIVDEACGRVRLGTMNINAAPRSLVLNRHAVALVVADHAGVALEELASEDRERLLDLESRLGERIVGQSKAVSAIARAVQSARVGLKPEGRPIGTFLLTGPSGVGKTALAEAVSELAFGKNGLVRVDLSEYQHSHEMSRLVGAPPGYVGHDREGVLTGALRRKPHSVVLFDEADKAHPAIFDLLLQVIDEGSLSDGQGKRIDCTQALFLLASNHLDGSQVKAPLGFAARREDAAASPDADREALGKAFRPEFLGRLDAVLRLDPLSESALREVASKLLADAVERLERLQVQVDVKDGVLDVLAKAGSDKLGARPIRALVERDVLGATSEILLRRGPKIRVVVGVDESANRVTVREEAS